MLIKAILELIRIIVLAGIYFYVLDVTFSKITRLAHITTPEWAKVILSILSLFIFFLWYRKRGQYKGWYPIAKKN